MTSVMWCSAGGGGRPFSDESSATVNDSLSITDGSAPGIREWVRGGYVVVSNSSGYLHKLQRACQGPLDVMFSNCQTFPPVMLFASFLDWISHASKESYPADKQYTTGTMTHGFHSQ